MKQRGVSAVGTAIVVLVVATAALLLFFIQQQVSQDQGRSQDIKNLRGIYVAAILYENLNDDTLPPRLDLTRNQFDDASIYLASGDPFKVGTNFPSDPAFPGSKIRLDYRISFTYLPEWILAHSAPGPSQGLDWRAATQASQGFLACYWYGTTKPTRPDGLDSNGEIVRINQDGSAKVLPAPPAGTDGDASALNGPGKRGRARILDARTIFGIRSLKARPGAAPGSG